jgi:hypothetical protein
VPDCRPHYLVGSSPTLKRSECTVKPKGRGGGTVARFFNIHKLLKMSVKTPLFDILHKVEQDLQGVSAGMGIFLKIKYF